jgi:hypothetical protein
MTRWEKTAIQIEEGKYTFVNPAAAVCHAVSGLIG